MQLKDVFSCFQKWRLPCLTTVKVPPGVDWKGVMEEMMRQGTEAGVRLEVETGSYISLLMVCLFR